MRAIGEGQAYRHFTQSSRSALGIGVIEAVEHRVHKEDIENLSVVSVVYLCDLCVKFFAFHGCFMNHPG
jgi:hypothetical protein